MSSFTRFWLVLALCQWLSLPGFSQSKNLILKLKPEWRTALADANSPLSERLKGLGMPQAKRRFAHHLPPDERSRVLGQKLVDLSLIHSVAVPAEVATDFFLQQVAKNPELEYAEWEVADAAPLLNPNDPRADSATGSQRQVLQKIRAYEAWSISQGDTNVVIGLLDTGTPVLHEDLQTQIKINPLDPPNGVDDDGNGLIDDYQGWDFGSGDSDPTPDNTQTAPGHGASVSSLACAATDNAKGIAGVGFRCKILPLKIWKWAGSFSNFRGYDAIVYAADRGCKVINCSWGSARSGNQFEQDIINYATFNKGSVVVAAGGNTAGFQNFVPANYDNVVGVSMTDTLDRMVSVSSQNFKLDVAAPGVGVFGIKTDNSYGWVDGGSSMASPLVAGAIGLVRAKFPELNGLQAAELIRVNTDSIYQIAANAGYRDKSGRGRLNIEKALMREQTVSLRPVELEIRNAKGLQAQAGDTIYLRVRFENYLDSVAGFEALAATNSTKIQFLDSSRTVGAMGSFTSKWLEAPFVAVVGNNVTPGEQINFRIQVKVGGQYSDQRWFIQYLNGRFLDLNANDVRITVTANGRQGFMDNNNYVGSGIRYKGSQYCGEAGLMIGSSATKVSNSVFNTSTKDDHFRTENNIDFKPFPGITEHAVNHCNDSAAGVRTIGVAFKQSSFELDHDSLRGSVFFNYQLTNRNGTSLDSLSLAHYTDWDIENYDQNFAAWDSSLQMGYSESVFPKKRLAAVQILTGGEPQFYAIDAVNSSANGNINLFDGFSLAEKWQTMSNGIGKQTAGANPAGNNVVTVTGVKLRNLMAGETRKVALAYLFADSLPELKKRARSTKLYFQNLHKSPSPLPKTTGFCSGDSVVENFEMPVGINRFLISAQPNLDPVLFSGTQYSSTFRSDTTLYLAGNDSLFSGDPVAWQYEQLQNPAAVYSYSPSFSNDSIPLGTTLLFSAADSSATLMNRWAVNGLTQPDTTHFIQRTFGAVGNVTICLQQSYRQAGCLGLYCKTVKVYQPVSTKGELSYAEVKVRLDFTNRKIQIMSPDDLSQFLLIDQTGKTVLIQPNMDKNGTIECSRLLAGFYYWKAISKSGVKIGKIIWP